MKKTNNCIMFIFAALFCMLFISCATQTAVAPNVPVVVSPTKPAPYFIQPGDQLDIKLFYNPELNETIQVRPDGKISLQLLDDVQAAGLTPSHLDQFLTEQYSHELKQPEVTVIVRSFTGQRVYVGGEVNRPGLVNLTAGMSALQAVINAGGLKETAKLEEAMVIRKGPDTRPIPLRVDLSNAIYGRSAEAHFQLKPYDIVYVPKSGIAKVNKFVNQYIERLLLFKGVSFGFSYEVHDAGTSD